MILGGDDFRMLCDSAQRIRESAQIMFEQRTQDERTLLYQATEMLAAARRVQVYGESILASIQRQKGDPR